MHSNNNISNSQQYDNKIQDLTSEITKLKNELTIEMNENKHLKNKIQDLTSEITKLKNEFEIEINKNKQSNNTINELEKQNSILIETNNRLNNELKLIKVKKFDNNQKSKIEDIINLYKKNEELKEKLSRYPIDLLEGEKLMSVIFSSGDQKIQYSVICKNTEKLNRLVEKLFVAYPEYSELNCYFISNGQKVNMYKTLDENKIQNNSVILLNKIEL